MDAIAKQRKLTELQHRYDVADENIHAEETNITIARAMLKNSAEKLINGIVDDENINICRNEITKYYALIIERKRLIDKFNGDKKSARKLMEKVIKL